MGWGRISEWICGRLAKGRHGVIDARRCSVGHLLASECERVDIVVAEAELVMPIHGPNDGHRHRGRASETHGAGDFRPDLDAHRAVGQPKFLEGQRRKLFERMTPA